MEVWILVHDWLESVLTETVRINVVKSSVEEFRFVAEEVLVPTDDGLVTKFDMEVLLMGVAETNAVLAILLFRFLKILRDHIDLLVHFLILFKYVLLHSVEAWF